MPKQSYETIYVLIFASAQLVINFKTHLIKIQRNTAKLNLGFFTED